MFKVAGGQLSRFQLTKWAFALSKDSESGGGATFYNFVPYKYGPFSFSLYQEMGKLCVAGLLNEDDKDHLSITSKGISNIGTLPFEIRKDIHIIAKRYGEMSERAMIDDIYNRHPWYTILSEIRSLEERPNAELLVYTAGYEGLSIDAFLNRLVQNGISCLVDVRKNPIARRYGFHKKTLNRLCEKLGIRYHHFPELGIRSEKRQNLTNPSAYQRLFEEYERTVLKQENDAVEEVAAIIERYPSVLVCSEADPAFCHRTHLGKRLSAMTDLLVRDLAQA
ncbi:MAG: DUF488 family protein [Myxococcota bacterium]|nr:DUF488 family protein [Myxococcota bacterium]